MTCGIMYGLAWVTIFNLEWDDSPMILAAWLKVIDEWSKP